MDFRSRTEPVAYRKLTMIFRDSDPIAPLAAMAEATCQVDFFKRVAARRHDVPLDRRVSGAPAPDGSRA